MLLVQQFVLNYKGLLNQLICWYKLALLFESFFINIIRFLFPTSTSVKITLPSLLKHV